MLDFGPLAGLIGVWEGSDGMDIAPEPDDVERSPYYETITVEPCGDLQNAEEQTLIAVRYLQIVKRKSNDEVFHDQTGYWMWEPATGLIMQSLVIPRGVSLTAGGDATTDSDGNVTLKVASVDGSKDWAISQPPFMQKKAKTLSYEHSVTVEGDTMKYATTTMLDIYGKEFRHTDRNTLVKVS